MFCSPLQFEPILKPRVWGGSLLRTRRGSIARRPIPEEPVGESWEVADLDSDQTRIRDGDLAGKTLRDLMGIDARSLLGDARPSAQGAFPLLIKYLDARQNLSVQVHPTPEYAAEHDGSHVKFEAWYVMEAAPGASLHLGLRPGVCGKDFERALGTPAIEAMLEPVPAIVGECHYLPSGLCHALGAGVVVAEVQTPSDTTFRLHDWGRSGRELHLTQGAQSTILDARPISRPGRAWEVENVRYQVLVNCPFFTIERVYAREPALSRLEPRGLPMTIMMIRGEAEVVDQRDRPSLSRMDTILAPACCSEITLSLKADSELLCVVPASPIHGMIA